MSFAELMSKSKSRLILALDLTGPSLLDRALKILDEVYPYVSAVKVNRHLSVPLNIEELSKLVHAIHDRGLLAIMDCKINDVGSTNKVMAELFFHAGFDALTASPFTGWKEGLEPVFNLAKDNSRGILVLVYMSHEGASENYERLVLDRSSISYKRMYEIFAEKALLWRADGAIVGATRPRILAEVKRLLKGKIPIYSPGIIVQGGSIEVSLKAGADYLIVGRAIVEAPNPSQVAANLNRLVEETLARLRGG
ncbi:MAG: orotidine 5'-phosphate decarboxylase [Thermoprotei archaeon]|nr:MAG: orotidine 5'-phosphate decarboxylase [Thermoprotei archaeon]